MTKVSKMTGFTVWEPYTARQSGTGGTSIETQLNNFKN